MAKANFYQQGFIFINELGQYAGTPRIRNGFGSSCEVIDWVDNINEAHVFPQQNLVLRFPELKKAQALKAVATREVLIRKWSEE